MTKKIEKVITTAGELKKVTLEEFISEVPVARMGELVAQYNACTSYGDSDNSNVPANGLPQEDDSTYVRTAVVLNENSLHNQLLHILDQVNFVQAEGKSRDEKIEHAAVTSLENFGLPTHVVEITWNCYGIFCINDFQYKLMDPTKGAIICYAPNRNLIFRTNWF